MKNADPLTLVADRAAPIRRIRVPPEVAAFVSRVQRLSLAQRCSLQLLAGRNDYTNSELSSWERLFPKRDSRGRFLGKRRTSDYLMVAALQTKYRGELSTASFQDCLRALRRLEPKRQASLGSLIATLVLADRDHMPRLLEIVVSVMHKSQIRIGWSSLLYDVLRWEHSDRFIQQRWSQVPPS